MSCSHADLTCYAKLLIGSAVLAVLSYVVVLLSSASATTLWAPSLWRISKLYLARNCCHLACFLVIFGCDEKWPPHCLWILWSGFPIDNGTTLSSSRWWLSFPFRGRGNSFMHYLASCSQMPPSAFLGWVLLHYLATSICMQGEWFIEVRES